jgi:shikimate dehydrogenase
VLVLGAGGAVRGVLGPLLAERPAELVIANRTVDRAERLAAEFIDLGAIRGVGFDAVGQEPWDIVINGTSASLAGEVPDLPARAVGPDSVCYDMAYARTDTPFQRWAASRGVRRSHKGWGMLVEQAAESWVVWRGTRPDTGPVLTALASL